MKVTVKYFASVREAFGLDTEVLELQDTALTVAQVIELLSHRSDGIAQVLNNPRIKAALNQKMCGLTDHVHDGAELALFPPVTGG